MSESQVFGLQPVLEALAAKRSIAVIWCARSPGRETDRVLQQAEAQGVRIKRTGRRALGERLGHDRHQGLLAELEADEAPKWSLDSLLAEVLAKEGHPLLILADGIQDPHNLGAIIRSAYALGADGILLPKDRAVGITPGVVRASAGAALKMPVCELTNLKHALGALSEAQIWTAAAVLDGDAVDAVDLNRPLALVIGSEHRGVKPSLAKRMDMRLSIPLARDFDSLNASVAAGILLYEIDRQRRKVE